jgi:hypothetical protein
MVDSYQTLQPEPDPNFAPSELLFRRVPIEDVANGSVSDSSLPSPSFSVNREKYCTAEQVVQAWQGFRVAAFMVGDIPVELKSDGGEVFNFGVEHTPEQDNYAHSDVNAYQEGMKLESTKKPPRHVRKKFRDLLRQRIAILDTPE